MSELFCTFYKPDKFQDEPYDKFDFETEPEPTAPKVEGTVEEGKEPPVKRKFGFFWPKYDDMVELCLKHDIEPKDLRLKKIAWKKDGCGFSLLKLIFKDVNNKTGIESPFFTCKDVDEDAYITSEICQELPIHKVALNIAENKYIEYLKFFDKHDNEIGKMAPCKCAPQDQEFVVPEGHSIVGLYGLSSSNKYVQNNEPRHFDSFRGLGFITMDLKPLPK